MAPTHSHGLYVSGHPSTPPPVDLDKQSECLQVEESGLDFQVFQLLESSETD